MPAKNKNLTPVQRVCALEWEAASEKLMHFLRDTSGHPDLGPDEMARMFDVLESALLGLRRVFEIPPLRSHRQNRLTASAGDAGRALRCRC